MGWLTGEDAQDVADTAVSHLHKRLLAESGCVRGRDDARVAAQRVVGRQWLLDKDVESCRGYATVC
jgi:hypothetical protein